MKTEKITFQQGWKPQSGGWWRKNQTCNNLLVCTWIFAALFYSEFTVTDWFSINFTFKQGLQEHYRYFTGRNKGKVKKNYIAVIREYWKALRSSEHIAEPLRIHHKANSRKSEVYRELSAQTTATHHHHDLSLGRTSQGYPPHTAFTSVSSTASRT